jgi:hypothetical protein
MKQFTLTSILIAIVATMLLYLTACSDDECTELRTENLFRTYIPYNGTETLKFLHNNTDTHTIKVYNKETYYTVEERIGDEGSCPTQYQAFKVNLLNQNTNQVFTLKYERDPSLFPYNSYGMSGHAHAFFKFSGDNAFFFKELLQSSKDSTIVLGKKYIIGRIIGGDTASNFIQYINAIGIIRIIIKGEKWELIP